MENIRTFSINLPFPLYEKILKKAGKRKVSFFIRKVLEEKMGEENELAQAYRQAYADNSPFLKEAVQWEKAQDEDWINWEQKKRSQKN